MTRLKIWIKFWPIPKKPVFIARITSYNVCYTKLLRLNQMVALAFFIPMVIGTCGNAGIHRIVNFPVKVDLLLVHLAGTFKTTHKIYKIARGPHGIDIDDHQVPLADHLVGGPAPIRAGVAA